MMPQKLRSSDSRKSTQKLSKRVLFGTPALDEIVENNSVSSSSREDNDMPRINIEGLKVL